ncbi:hypothetical protein MBLNU459_g3691t1 [Dothideomycetes sp. NU459]
MEKNETLQTERAIDEKHSNVAEIKTITGNEAFHEALLKEPLRPWAARSLFLYFACLIGFFCSTANGYDGSLLNQLLINPTFKDFFHGSNSGIWAGIVSSMYQIGSVAGIPFIGPAIDRLGRRGGMFLGAMFIIVGTITQGSTSHLSNYKAATHQFMGGRFLLGFGVSIVASAGPMYVVEVVHPAQRGVVTALYNTFWFTGSIVASGAGRGALNLTGNITWLLPTWLQLLFSCFIVVFIFWMPESPRWQYVNGKQEKARNFLIKFHGHGNPESVWVRLQLSEYEQHLDLDGADKRWWDYRALFRSKASCYRIGINVMVSLWGQWAGNSVLSYFLGAVLDTAGITDPIKQSNISLGINCAQFAFAIFGATMADRIGRRPLLLFANIGCGLTWIGMTASSAVFSESGSKNAGAAKATLGFIYIFSFIFSIGFTPLQALYPVEVLSFEMRAKGMAFSNLAVSAGGLLNQFAWPVALAKIGWKTYIVFSVWCFVQAGTIYLFAPETKNRTLEELDDIFNQPNPRKASTKKHVVAIDSDANVVDVQDA